ncbi:phosphate ABC transporter, permease protein PstA [Actinomyces oris]|nr:phosphate ABC transporter, permease protein PstA [Actinomyces oris]
MADPPTIEGVPLTSYRLPDWFIWAALGAAFVVVGGIGLLAGWSIAAVVTLTALVWVVGATAVSWVREGERWGRNTLVTLLIYLSFAVVMVPLVSLVWMVLSGGSARFGYDFLTTNMRGADASNGGFYHGIVGTLQITGIATLISVPLGLFTAVFLVEYNGGWIARVITFLVDVMTGIPSIVAGLFAYSIFLIVAGPRYQAGIIGAVALSVLMTPVVIRGVEEMLKLVPSHLREASYALGVPKWLTIVKVVLRTAVAGITTSVMIAIARVIGETAPLLITVGLTIRTNTNPLNGSMSTLPVLVYDQYSRGEASAMERAWAGALTLIILVMLLNLAARLISKYFSPKGGRR